LKKTINISVKIRLLILIFSVIIGFSGSINAQTPNDHPAVYFISDCQKPLPIEKIIREIHNNMQATEMLFTEIEKSNEGYVFMPGDLVGRGSDNSEWQYVDTFLNHLRRTETKVFAIPGNHEYLLSSSKGVANFQKRFPGISLSGYLERIDSMAFVMLNSNFGELSTLNNEIQQKWYNSIMDSLDVDEAIRIVIVCAHHSPFSNSKVVGSSAKVQEAFVPRFQSSPKAKLFITGHSHNLELFDGTKGKRFLVIGGGGGIDQPLLTGNKAKYMDLTGLFIKPRYFYLVVHRNDKYLELTIKGLSEDLAPVREIKLLL
jgi:Icc-related predicted phosphoesterase